MESEGLWNINVHSYRKQYSTTTALLEVCDRIFTASDEREIAIAMAIDESAAFDVIQHNILLNKLKMYKFHETTLKWIKDYLQLRTQFVTIGGQNSTMRNGAGGGTPGVNIRPSSVQHFY